MYPEATLSRGFATQRGAGLPIALFVITVLALIVAGMSQLQESTATAVSLQIQSQRAFFAAESGAQVGVAEVLGGGSCAGLTSPLDFSSDGLSNCQAILSCSAISADIDGDGVAEPIFTVTSTGSCGTGLDSAQRMVEVRVR